MSKQNNVVGFFTKVSRVFPGCFKRIPWTKPVGAAAGWCVFGIALAAAIVAVSICFI